MISEQFNQKRMCTHTSGSIDKEGYLCCFFCKKRLSDQPFVVDLTKDKYTVFDKGAMFGEKNK